AEPTDRGGAGNDSASASAEARRAVGRARRRLYDWRRMVVIKGTGFIDVVNVAFGANPATWCVKSPTEIIAIAPPGEEGLTSVTVTNLTDSHTLPDCFTYVEMPLEEQSGGESQCQSGNDGEGDASQDQPGQSDKGKGSSS